MLLLLSRLLLKLSWIYFPRCPWVKPSLQKTALENFWKLPEEGLRRPDDVPDSVEAAEKACNAVLLLFFDVAVSRGAVVNKRRSSRMLVRLPLQPTYN